MEKALSLVIEQVLAAWNHQNNQFISILSSLSDEQLSRQVSPGRNSGSYLLGHLVAVSDGMLPILGYGERLFPEYDSIFLDNPDGNGLARPSLPALRQSFETINTRLTEDIWSTPEEEWMRKHSLVTEEAFADQPHRNKLNVIINRTNHLAYHLGQLFLLKVPNGQPVN